jgi:D-alanyl-D-alanine carboxypeptidase
MHFTGGCGPARGAVAIVAIFALMAAFMLNRPAFAGYASIVVDAGTGEVLNEVNADEENYPASLTKMMTLYLAFEALRDGRLHWDQRLTVTEFAAEKSPTKLGVAPGETLPVRDCVLAMIVLSANDAATVMGEALGGSEPGFSRMMTEKARALGMTGTVFKNAAGLPDEEQVTTARDLVKLAMALYRDFPDRYALFATREFEFKGRRIMGHNHLMYRYPGMDGLKTGFTVASGFNLASSAIRGSRRLFGVVMGGQSGFARDQLMATLLDNAFAGRQTDPILVAEAGGQSRSVASRVLAELSPVGHAEAATLEPAAARTARRSNRAEAEAGDEHEVHQGQGRAELVPAVDDSRWMIQIGAYHGSEQAEAANRDVLRLASLRGKQPEVLVPSGAEKYYRARLAGFGNEAQARDACRAVHKSGHDCAIVPPGKVGLHLAAAR